MSDVILVIHKNMIGASLVAPLGFIFKRSSLRSLRDVIIVKHMMITTQVRHRTHFDLMLEIIIDLPIGFPINNIISLDLTTVMSVLLNT